MDLGLFLAVTFRSAIHFDLTSVCGVKCGPNFHVWICTCLMTACCKDSLSCVQLFTTLWTVAHQAPLSVGILQARILEWVAVLSFGLLD